jgi:hypothetical protein
MALYARVTSRGAVPDVRLGTWPGMGSAARRIAIGIILRIFNLSPCYSTVRVNVKECDKAPEVAVTVTV